MLFAKNMGKNICKNISKNLSCKCSKNFLIILNNLQQMRLKLLQTEQFKKTAEATGGLIDNKIPNAVVKYYHGKITGVSNSPQ